MINGKRKVNIIMNIAENRHGAKLVVAPSGRIDSQTSPLFDRHLTAVIERGDVNLVIDLTGLDYISSTGLSAFLSAAKKFVRLAAAWRWRVSTAGSGWCSK